MPKRADMALWYDASDASTITTTNLLVVSGWADKSGNGSQKIEGYLAHKWGTADKLPGGYPYKSSAPAYAGTLILVM